MVLNYLGDHTLYEYITIASAYSDRKFDEYYVDAPAITSTYRKPHTCIRHMDIRNDSLYLGHSEQWDTIDTTYTYIIPYDNFYGFAYKTEYSTTEIERDQWMELRSLGHPNVELWQPTESTEVDTSEIITPGDAWPACSLSGSETDEEIITPTSDPAPWVGISTFIHTWVEYPLGPLTEWPYNFRGEHSIAFSCPGDRMISLQDFYEGGSYQITLIGRRQNQNRLELILGSMIQ